MCCGSAEGAEVEVARVDPQPTSSRGQVKLYGLSPSGNCASTYMLVEQLQVGDWIPLDPMSGEHKKPDFLAIHPRGVTPGIQDGELKGGESGAIMRYLAMQYDKSYFPVDDPPTAFKVDFAMDDWRDIVNAAHGDVCYVAAGFWPLPEGVTQDEANKKFGDALLEWIARHVTGKFVLGDTVSIADLRAVPAMFQAMQPGVAKKTGFVLPERCVKYVEDVKSAMPTGFAAALEGDLKAFFGGLDAPTSPPKTPVSPQPEDMTGKPVKVGVPAGRGKIVIHTIPPSQNGASPVVFALELKVGEFQMCNLFTGDQKKPEFLAKNPGGTVPCLEDGSVTGGQSNAILRYLALSYAPEYYPISSPGVCYKIDWAMDETFDIMTVHKEIVYPSMGFVDKWPADVPLAAKNYADKIALWMKIHKRGKFVIGDTVTIADVKVLPIFYAAIQPLINKKSGFVPPPGLEDYVKDIMAALPTGSAFLTSADGYSIKEFCASKES